MSSQEQNATQNLRGVHDYHQQHQHIQQQQQQIHQQQYQQQQQQQHQQQQHQQQHLMKPPVEQHQQQHLMKPPAEPMERVKEAKTSEVPTGPPGIEGIIENIKSLNTEEFNSKYNKKLAEAGKRFKMQHLVQSFSEDQLLRYEMYRRSSFPKAAFKRMMQNVSGSGISQNVVIAMSGIAKIYLGEIMEEALDVLERLGEKPPVTPKHIREAVRKLKSRKQRAISQPEISM